MKYLICYLIAITMITFFIYGLDKRKARRGRYRISEKTLFVLALIGGSAGALLGMLIFHHKTKKLKFMIGIPLILAAHVALAIFAGVYVHEYRTNSDVTQVQEETSTDTEEEAASEETIINASGETLSQRIKVPLGYERTSEEKDSLAQFLRDYPMEEDNSPIRLYDGREKDGVQAAVFSMYLGDQNLQQCADSVIRVYAEYLRSIGQDSKIQFHFVNGFLCDWDSYKAGKRISVNGNDVSWVSKTGESDSDETFEGYLNTVFSYASTISMEAESEEIKLSQLKVGDIFIEAGSPGHVVMVVDTCEKDGKKAFLLAQGYMPAQQFHVLKNPEHEDDPWYYEEEVTYPFKTIEYTFSKGSLMRPSYLKNK
ncbi:MAG: DUF1294 domain-containing protein [Eubacterium sp.]|nr:DUF1294 domain-containing protein [Eubacterium sp.]